MRGLLADNNAEGDLSVLLRRLLDNAWLEFWNELDLHVVSFEEIGLPRNADDRTLWKTCQNDGLVLITVNRNAHGPDSLQAVIPDENTQRSLPVVTIANPDRVRMDSEYAAHVAERLLEYLLEIDKLLGAGRIYIP